MGRPARGVRGMELEEGDYLVGVEVVEKEGRCSRFRERIRQAHAARDYRLTARGRKGVINMKTTPRVGKVVGILSVKEDSELMIITKQGQIIRIDSSEIRQGGAFDARRQLVNVEAGDQVAAASLIPDTVTRDTRRAGRPAATIRV